MVICPLLESNPHDKFSPTRDSARASCPEVRFGQLLANLSYLAKGPTNEAIWDMEDEELLVAAKQHLETLSKRHSSVT